MIEPFEVEDMPVTVVAVNAKGENFRIGIKVPEFDSKLRQRKITVGNERMATLGVYRNFFENRGCEIS